MDAVREGGTPALSGGYQDRFLGVKGQMQDRQAEEAETQSWDGGGAASDNSWG